MFHDDQPLLSQIAPVDWIHARRIPAKGRKSKSFRSTRQANTVLCSVPMLRFDADKSGPRLVIKFRSLGSLARRRDEGVHVPKFIHGGRQRSIPARNMNPERVKNRPHVTYSQISVVNFGRLRSMASVLCRTRSKTFGCGTSGLPRLHLRPEGISNSSCSPFGLFDTD